MRVFHCRLCWIIAGAVFASILVIEGMILIPSYHTFQQDQQAQLKASGLRAVQNMFIMAGQQASTDALLKLGETWVQRTVLHGASLHTKDGAWLGAFGTSPTQKRLSPEKPLTTGEIPGERRIANRCTTPCLDVTWLPTQVGAPFIVEARLDSSNLEKEGAAYIRRILGLVLIIALFVTGTTMMVLSQLVLSPILLLRQHMISAGEDADAPLRHTLPIKDALPWFRHELGHVFEAFNDMLKRLSDGVHALHAANDQLGQRVNERTVELHKTTRTLEQEMAERTQAEQKIQNLARFPDENRSPVLRANQEGIVLYANTASDFLLHAWHTQQDQRLPSEWAQLILDVFQTGTDKDVETVVGDRIFSIRLAPILDAGYVNLYGTDITERKEFETQLRHMANHDTLTGLPNQSLFQDRWQRAIHQARENHTMAAILLVGLDGFKEVDQVAGREAGNTLRKTMAQRLSTCLPETTTVARLGGDLFAVIHDAFENLSDPADRAQQILTVLSKPLPLEGETMDIQASVGISLFPSDGEAPEHLIHLADLALSRAKADARRDSYRFYEGGMNEAVQTRRDLLRDLRSAVERGQMELHYQPQISLSDNRLIGMEALLRWRHPVKGMISPGHFIPLAEESQLIIPMGLWVLQTAAKQNKQWQDAGLPPLKVAVNLSSVQFGESDLVETVDHAIRESGLEPRFLELEITESVAVEGIEKTIPTLEALRHLGLSLSIDDFGTGYSSLSYLKKFPVGKVKIDRSFVLDIEKDADSAALCNAIIQLGHSLNLQVIAEGVETLEQLQMIQTLGCDQVQGYYYSRPLEVEAFARFVQEWDPGKKAPT